MGEWHVELLVEVAGPTTNPAVFHCPGCPGCPGSFPSPDTSQGPCNELNGPVLELVR